MYEFISFIIKYFCIIFCSHYVFINMLNIKQRLYNLFFTLTLSLAMPTAVYFLRQFSSSYLLSAVSLLIMVAVSIIFNILSYKKSLYMSVSCTTIAYGISLCVFIIPTFIISPAILYYSDYASDIRAAEVFSFMIVGSAQIVITFFIFKIKRFKSGWRFLEDYGKSDVGFAISICILLSYSLFAESAESTSRIYIIPIFFILMAGLIILMWSRMRIAQNYIDKLRVSDLTAFDGVVAEKDEYIARLEKSNENLSKIIHKDNKLIPALEMAVTEFISNGGDNADELIGYIKRVSSERKSIMEEYENRGFVLPSSNVICVDTVLKYMASRAKEGNIDFNVTIGCDVKYMLGNIISESDLETLLADLIENALIACQSTVKKQVLVNIGLSNNVYSIDIFDSGVEFPLHIIESLGNKRITTHKSEGGSGIGMMTAFETAKKYSASIIIEEYSFKDSPFTKKIALRFDNKNKHYFITKRTDSVSDISGNFTIV